MFLPFALMVLEKGAYHRDMPENDVRLEKPCDLEPWNQENKDTQE